jgi:hypothetical protein
MNQTWRSLPRARGSATSRRRDQPLHHNAAAGELEALPQTERQPRHMACRPPAVRPRTAAPAAGVARRTRLREHRSRAREHGQRLDGRVARRVQAHLGREAFRRRAIGLVCARLPALRSGHRVPVSEDRRRAQQPDAGLHGPTLAHRGEAPPVERSGARRGRGQPGPAGAPSVAHIGRGASCAAPWVNPKAGGAPPGWGPEPRGVRHPSAHAEERMARAASVTVPSGDAAASPFEGKARKPRSRPSDREPCPSAGMRSSSCLTRCRSVSRVARRRWSQRRWPTSFTISRTRRRSDPARHSPRGRAEPARLCRRPRRRTTSALADTATSTGPHRAAPERSQG